MAKERPLVFIGSSAEGLPVAKAIQAELQYAAESVIWSQGPFGLNAGSLESLVNSLDSFDFAILVLSPDDLVESRGQTQRAPRDNVLLELGIFIGGLGRTRTFMVIDRTSRMKLPTDLAGITPATYQPPDAGPMRAAVGPACTEIEEVIKRLGARDARLPVEISGAYFVDGPRDRGILFTVKNVGKEPVPPYKVGIVHPTLGSWYMFPSDRSGPLLPDQQREHRCRVITGGRIEDWFPKFQTDGAGRALDESADDQFAFCLVLEDSDKVLYENKRIAKGFIKLIRLAHANQTDIGGTALDWAELSTAFHGD